MIYTISKILITSLLVIAIAEVAKRSSLFGALLASLPLTSILAMVWLYLDSHDVSKVTTLATSIFWLVIPSLVFFLSLPLLLKQGLSFYLSMGLSMSITAGCYFLMIQMLLRYGIKL